LTKEEKKKLIIQLENFQRDEWDNLSDEEFLVITQAGIIIGLSEESKEVD
jgi:hypothetical protein